MLEQLIAQLTNLKAFDEIVDRGSGNSCPGGIFAKIQHEAGIGVEFRGAGLRSVPKSGPMIVVANHPTGFAEGLAIPAMLDGLRSDVFVLAHSFFSRWSALAERMILVDPQARRGDTRRNSRAMLTAARKVRDGACVVLFPSAEVARPDPLSLQAVELQWRLGLAKLVKLTNAPILPVHVAGATSRMFRLVSSLHPRLGVPLLFREAMDRVDPLVVTVGSPISARRFLSAGGPAESVSNCRAAVLELAGASGS